MAIGDTDYLSTLSITDVVNNGVAYTIDANANLAVDNTGYNQGALYTLLNEIVTNFNAMLVKVKADGAAGTYTFLIAFANSDGTFTLRTSFNL